MKKLNLTTLFLTIDIQFIFLNKFIYIIYIRAEEN